MYKSLVILSLLILVISQTGPLVGDIDQVNGVPTMGLSLWDGKVHNAPSQDFASELVGTFLASAYNPRGDAFYAKQTGAYTYIEFQNSTIRTRIGGRNGYFTGPGVIQQMVASNNKLWVCGTFSSAGSLFVNQTGLSGPLSGMIVELDITNGVSVTSSFSTILSRFDQVKMPAGFNCAGSRVLWNLNGVLVAREAYDNAPLIKFNAATPSAISGLTTNITQVYVTNFQNETNYLYALGSNMADNSGILPFISKYSGSDAKWDPLFPSTSVSDGNALSVVIRQFIVGPSDVVYLTFIADVFGDVATEFRARYVYQHVSGTTKKLMKDARFVDSLSTFAIIDSSAYSLVWDPMVRNLMVWGNSIAGVIYGDDTVMDVVDWYKANTHWYAKKLDVYVHLGVNSTSWVQAFGGGVSLIAAPVAPIFTNNMVMIRYASYGWNTRASKVITWNNDKQQYDSFFASGKGLDYYPAGTGGSGAQIYAYDDDFSQSNGGILAGVFRSIDNVTCNSICMVSSSGVPTALGNTSQSHGDVGVREFATSGQNFEYRAGLIRTIVHLATSKYTYVAGKFDLAGNVGVQNIARYNWESKTWHDVAGGVNGQVFAMLRDNELIYVGGDFSVAGGKVVNNIAVFNTITQTWNALNYGLDGAVAKLFWFSGKVTAVGLFSSGSGASVKGNTLKQISQWDGKRWTGLIGGFAKALTEADSCSVSSFNNLCTVDIAGGGIQEASVVGGTLWVVTGQGADNIYSYDGRWVRYQTPPATHGGRAMALLPGFDGKPVFQMNQPSFGAEWRVFDQGLDNFILPRYISRQSISQKSFGSVAQLNLLLLALATILVFMQ